MEKLSKGYVWRILLVDDDEDDYYLTRSMLDDARRDKFILEWASTFDRGLEALDSRDYDAILVDYDLGAETGIALIHEALKRHINVPIVVLTGRGSYEIDLEAMEAGASDYLSKSEITPSYLERSIRYAIERKQSEEKLHQQRQDLADILASISDEFFALDHSWCFRYVNTPAASYLGRKVEDLIGKNIWQEFPQLVDGPLWQNCHRVVETRQPARFEMEGMVTPGNWYELAVYPTTSGVSVYWIDITEKKVREHERERLLEEVKKGQALAEQSAALARQAAKEAQTAAIKMETIINNLADAVLVFDPDGVCRLANSASIAMLGLDPLWKTRPAIFSDLTATTFDGEPLPEGELPEQQSSMNEIVINRPMIIQNQRGRKYSILFSALPLVLGRESGGVVVVLSDITEQGNLQRLQVQQIQNLAQLEVQRRLIDQREQERMQIARDLHDGPLQEWIGISYTIDEALHTATEPQVIELLKSMKQAVQKEIHDLRLFASQLRPPMLAHYGLERAIRAHLGEFEEKHPDIQVNLSAQQVGGILPEAPRLALYRIYQELMNNIVKHAGASVVYIRFEKTEKEAILEVQDDGKGFTIPTDWLELARHKHLGLVGVQERAQAVGGKVEIQSCSGCGTTVRVMIPLDAIVTD